MRARAGFTLVEVMIVIVMIGIMTAMVVPRFRASAQQRTQQAADQLARDLEAVRTQALASRASVRLFLTTVNQSYTGYLDYDRDGTFAMNQAETDSLRVLRTRVLENGSIYSRGATPAVPGFAGAGAITFPNAWVDFDPRGLTIPLGTRGVIYLAPTGQADAVAAVTVTQAAGIQSWVYSAGVWR